VFVGLPGGAWQTVTFRMTLKLPTTVVPSFEMLSGLTPSSSVTCGPRSTSLKLMSAVKGSPTVATIGVHSHATSVCPLLLSLAPL
jgi:hypothetical protein